MQVDLFCSPKMEKNTYVVVLKLFVEVRTLQFLLI